jgi:hypothetical protein
VDICSRSIDNSSADTADGERAGNKGGNGKPGEEFENGIR